MRWKEASEELQRNGTPLSVIGYCKIAFDLGQEARPKYSDLMQHLDSLQEKLELLEKENVRLRKYIQGQHEAALQTIDAYQKQIEVLTCKRQ